MICGLAAPGKPDTRICFVCNDKKAGSSPTYKAICDTSNCMEDNEYFKLLQDPGIEMNDDEKKYKRGCSKVGLHSPGHVKPFYLMRSPQVHFSSS